MPNRFFWKTACLFFLYLFIEQGVKAQAPDTTIIVSQREADSLMALLTAEEYDSLMNDVNDLFALLDDRGRSYVDLSLTAGNGNFTLKNNPAETDFKTRKRFVFSPSAGYYNKTGLGAQLTSFFAPSGGNLRQYQYQGSLFYDYVKSKKISAGISYSRLIAKESAVDFYTTPFKNNFNLYGTWRKSRLRPTLSFSYSNGSYIEEFVRPLFSVSYKVLIQEYSVNAAVRYSWDKRNWLKRGDLISIVPRLVLVNSGQNLELQKGDNTPILNRLISTGIIPQRSVNEFEPQLLALYLSMDYMLGKWYFHPQFYIDYYLHSSSQRSFNTFSITTGFIF